MRRIWRTPKLDGFYDLYYGLRPGPLACIAFLACLTFVGLIWALAPAGPPSAVDKQAHLYMYSATAQSMAAALVLAITALLILSQVSGQRFSWAFTRLIIKQRLFQVCLGWNVGVIMTPLVLLVSPDGGRPAHIAVLASAVGGFFLLFWYVLRAVGQLDPSRLIDENVSRAETIIRLPPTPIRVAYVKELVGVLRDIGTSPRVTLEESNAVVFAPVSGLIRLQQAFRQNKASREWQPRISEDVRDALADIGKAIVTAEKSAPDTRPLPVNDFLVQVQYGAIDQGGYICDFHAWDDSMYVLYKTSSALGEADCRDWWETFTRIVCDQLKLVAPANEPWHTLPQFEAALYYALLVCRRRLEEGEGKDAALILRRVFETIKPRLENSLRTAQIGAGDTIEPAPERVCIWLLEAVISLGAHIVHRQAELTTQRPPVTQLSPIGKGFKGFMSQAVGMVKDIAKSEFVPTGTILEDTAHSFHMWYRETYSRIVRDYWDWFDFDEHEKPLVTPGRVLPGRAIGPPEYIYEFYALLRCRLSEEENLFAFSSIEPFAGNKDLFESLHGRKSEILERWKPISRDVLGIDESYLDRMLPQLIRRLGELSRSKHPLI